MSNLKKSIYKNKKLYKTLNPIYQKFKSSRNFTSANYWEKRYIKGGNSGAGSYGRLAEFKASYLNDFVKFNKLNSVIEFGSGDGAQLKHFKFKNYVGFDVSKKSIDLCCKIFSNDISKSFFLYEPAYFVDNHKIFKADLTLSLDVIYHLVEDDVYEKYMNDLFKASTKFVVIYASNTNDNSNNHAQHVRHRKFTVWVKANQIDWKLVEKIKNKHSITSNEIDESFADFFVFEKVR